MIRVIILSIIIFASGYSTLVCNDHLNLFHTKCFDTEQNKSVELSEGVYQSNNGKVYILGWFDIAVISVLIACSILLDLYLAFLIDAFVFAIALSMHASTSLFYIIAFTIAILIMIIKNKE